MNKTNMKKPKKKLSKSAIVLIISCIIIAIPVIVFLIIIISASINTGQPIIGSRFDNDLNPSITSKQEKAIVSSVKSLSGVEDCEVVLKTADFRVNVDANNDISEEGILTLAKSVYDTVNETLPVSTYFKISSDGEKMYDLSITVYNYVADNTEDQNWICLTYYHNSNMDEPLEEWLSKADDEKLVDELRNGTSEENPEEPIKGEVSEETSE